MDRRTVGTKNPGCCREMAVIYREVAVSGGLTVIIIKLLYNKLKGDFV